MGSEYCMTGLCLYQLLMFFLMLYYVICYTCCTAAIFNVDLTRNNGAMLLEVERRQLGVALACECSTNSRFHENCGTV